MATASRARGGALLGIVVHGRAAGTLPDPPDFGGVPLLAPALAGRLQRYPPAHEGPHPMLTVLRTGRPVLKEPPGTLVETARRNLETMLALINDLLDASKLASGHEPLAPQPTEVGTLVRESVQVVGAEAREKGVRLETAVAAGPRVSADPVKLEQVLVNLLANAVKFTPAGGVVGVEAGATGGHVVFRVHDTGEGIASEHLEAIFEPFFQVHG